MATSVKQHILRALALALGIEHEEKVAVAALKAKKQDEAKARVQRAQALRAASKRINAQPEAA